MIAGVPGHISGCGIPGCRSPGLHLHDRPRPPVPPSSEQVDAIARKIGEEKRKIEEGVDVLEELAAQLAEQVPDRVRAELAGVFARNGLQVLADLLASTLEPSPDDPQA